MEAFIPKKYGSLFKVNNCNGENLYIDSRALRLSRTASSGYKFASVLGTPTGEMYTSRDGTKNPKLGHRKGWTMKMITLTFKNQNQWHQRVITEFMRKLKRTIGQDNWLGYFWVHEMQQREVSHYHIIISVRKGVRVPMPDKEGLWAYGHTKIETAMTPHYISKYVGKEYQKEGLPKGARIYGSQINPRLINEIQEDNEAIERLVQFKRRMIPKWALNQLSKEHYLNWEIIKFMRIKGGGIFVDVKTGEIISELESPYEQPTCFKKYGYGVNDPLLSRELVSEILDSDLQKVA